METLVEWFDAIASVLAVGISIGVLVEVRRYNGFVKALSEHLKVNGRKK